MTQIYCGHHHGSGNGGLCPDCTALMRYAERRLEKCPYGSDKPACNDCPVHCYKPAQRENVRNVMRFAGPRMSWRHPLRALTHLFDSFRKVEHPKVARDRARNEKRRREGAADQ